MHPASTEPAADVVRTVVAEDTVFLLREWAAAPDSQRVPVLLLHGVPETSSSWREVAPRLAAGGRRVLAPDLPGLGGSTYPGPYDVPALAAQVAALLDAEQVGQVDVVGHDWGGVVALGLAGVRPGRVRRLVVADAPYRTPPPLHRSPHLALLALPVLPDLAFRVAGRRLVGLLLRAGWRSPRPLDAERRAEYEAAYGTRDRLRAFLGYYRAAVRPRPGAWLPGSGLAGLPPVKVDRALVLWGALDPALPISTGEAAVRDLGAGTRMTTVPGVGHFVVEEAPDVVAEVLLDFLA